MLNDPDFQDLNNHNMHDAQIILDYVRGDGQVYNQSKAHSLAFYEIMTACQEVADVDSYLNLSLRRDILDGKYKQG